MARIKVVMVRVGQPAVIEEIENSLEAMQATVGGYIEIARKLDLGNQKVIFVCNEEGIPKNLPANRTIQDALLGIKQSIRGDFFITKEDDDGNFISFSNQEANSVVEWMEDTTSPRILNGENRWAKYQAPQKEEPAPVRYMRLLADYFPNLWSLAETFREKENEHFPQKPKWCYLSASFIEVIYKLNQFRYGPKSEVQRIAVRMGWPITVWRLGQGIYKFSDELSSELDDLDVNSQLPTEILLKIPEWCLYIDLTNSLVCAKYDVKGAFVCLAWHPGDKEKDSCFLHICILKERVSQGKMEYFPCGQLIDLAQGQTIYSATQEMLKILKEEIVPKDTVGQLTEENIQLAHEELTLVTSAVVNRTIYICCINADIQGKKGKPRKPQPIKTSSGTKLFAATNPTVWEVGYRIGQVMRLAREATRKNAPREEEEAARKKPIAHLRKAHFHHYWTGKRNEPEKRKLIAKFLHPILVNCEDPDKLIPTIYPVE